LALHRDGLALACYGKRRGWPVFVMLDAPFAEGSTRTAVLWFLFQLASAATCRHADTPAAGLSRPASCSRLPAAVLEPRCWRPSVSKGRCREALRKAQAAKLPGNLLPHACCGDAGALLAMRVNQAQSCLAVLERWALVRTWAHGFAGMPARRRVDMPTC
jgi:hypothetical protein